ncbi:uncharacterized protein LOC127814255 [Diospyros lotus]|uniref:uncharacterized protein LOC127814255 n=1 Tax=Diospyros lotus TaxID=55363 RepID=UPI00224FED35|nr:uncharacterized protein LOC127814255 [Diospyros lotus]
MEFSRIKTKAKPFRISAGLLCFAVGTSKRSIMAWRGSLSRSLISTARTSTIRPSLLPIPRLRAPPVPGSRRLSFANPRRLGELGCAHSLMPLQCLAAEPAS